MTSHLFATFHDASAFAKQVTLKHQTKASVARSTDGFIVTYTIPTTEECEPVISLTGNANKNPENSNAEKSRQPTQNPQTSGKNDESKGQITKQDLNEVREKLENLIANEKKERKEKLLNENKATEDRERKKAEKIKQRDEKLKAERFEREKHAGLDKHKPKANEKAGKTTGTVLDDQSERMGTTICPKCGGNGGANGGCTKCDGTGWAKGISELKNSSSSCATWSINEGIAGTRDENKKMRGQLWGDMRNRGRGC